MKKLFILIALVILLIPNCVNASKIVSSSINAKHTVLQGEEFEIEVTINYEGLGVATGDMVTIISFEVKSDNSMLTIESASAENYNTMYGKIGGVPVVYSMIDMDKVIMKQDCTNNVFCNTFKTKLKVFAKGVGTTNFNIGSISAQGGNYYDEENLFELEFTSPPNGVNINITKASHEIEAPTEKIATIDTTKPRPIVTTKKNTTKVTETITEEATLTTQKTQETSELEKDEIKEDKEKRDKINKKIISYAIIGVVIILLLVIANAIINKIRYRKMDKMLKKF